MRLLRRTDLHTLTGAYAVDALDGPERERFERHLHRCPACDNEVRGLQETATRFGMAVAQPPPPGLKMAVLIAAARTRQHPPVVDSSPEPRPATRPGPGWLPRLAVPVAALATAAAIVLAVTLGVQHGELGRARAQQRQTAAALARTQAEERLVTATLARTRAQQHRATATLTALGARVVTGRTSLGGRATMIISARLDRMVFTARGLPAQPASRVYQLWLLGPTGAATSAGLLPGSHRGRLTPVVAARPGRGDHIAVTVEPAGGTAQPTTKPIVILAVPA
jgi:anti-sigma-K factor RskA